MAMLNQGVRRPAALLQLLQLGTLVLLCIKGLLVNGQAYASTSWNDGHATFYGGQDASGTMGGSCGYGNLYSTGYGTSTAALSVAMFNNGLSCGACYQLVCKTGETSYCYGGQSITVTATNACPQGSYGGWCDSPKLHFDLSYPMFTTLAQAVGGVIPVQFRRVTCQRSGGVRFQLNGNPYFLLTLVYNVAGGGDVHGLSVKGDNTGWFTTSQNWGENWELDGQSQLVGHAISFIVRLGSGESKEFDNVASGGWSFGQTFDGGSNF